MDTSKKKKNIKEFNCSNKALLNIATYKYVNINKCTYLFWNEKNTSDVIEIFNQPTYS